MGADLGYGVPFDDTPTLDHLCEAIETKDSDDRQGAAATLRVQLFRDADAAEPVSTAISVRKWLAFETDFDGQRYCLHEGRWYQMDQRYAERLHARTQEIFARDPGFSLPEWTTGHTNEKAYNVAAATKLGGIPLDRDMIRTSMHPAG